MSRALAAVLAAALLAPTHGAHLRSSATTAAAARAALPPGVDDVVTIDTGAIRGVRSTPSNLRYWLGVPYAADTAGANTWLPPQPRAPWAGTRDATTWGFACTQPHHGPDAPSNQSSDCLNVNVYAPAASSGPLPVMVFIHGGAWLEGSNQG